MPLQTTGSISLSDIGVEAGYSSGSTVSLNMQDVRELTPAAGKTINSSFNTEISLNDFYGASNIVTGTLWTLNANNTASDGWKYASNVTVSAFASSGFAAGDTLEIPADTYVSSGSTYYESLEIDMPCTVINYGRIMGRGQDGGTVYATGPTQYVGQNYLYPTGRGAGSAIKVSSTGVTIINQSGAWIVGGGGGGANGYVNASNNAGGGGGAGGGRGGSAHFSNTQASGGARGDLYTVGSSSGLNHGARGENYIGSAIGGYGGGAGGGGATTASACGGGGGGMQLSGTGGNGNQSAYPSRGAGGSAGNAGNGVGGGITNFSGGGGGYGASGGAGQGGYAGGAGGPAIEGTSRTLTNNGTIYGST